MSAPRILLAVDMSYQVYRAAAAHPMLTSRRVFTGGLYGFFAFLGKAVRETQATHIAFCRDVKPYKRSEVYPAYKSFRKAKADDGLKEMFTQSMKLVLEGLEDSGARTWGLQGFESDDLIGHCVMKYRNRFDRIYAASNDSDLWQLLWADNFRIYRTGIADVMSGDKLARKGFTPEEHMLATALMGTHNDIEGIPRVGEVTAFKAVKDAAAMRAMRERHGALIDRNLALIKLPHPEFPREVTIPTHEGFNRRTLYSYLGRYDIDVTGAMTSAFEALQGDK